MLGDLFGVSVADCQVQMRRDLWPEATMKSSRPVLAGFRRLLPLSEQALHNDRFSGDLGREVIVWWK